MAANAVLGRYNEDYPETYKDAGGLSGHTDEDKQQHVLVGQMEGMAADLGRRAALRASTEDLTHLTTKELEEEHTYIVRRLFGGDPGRALYQGVEMDQLYTDSADEVAMQFLQSYKERFGREPPQTLVEYAFPLLDASESRRKKVRAALDAAYARLRAAAQAREARPAGVFLACPAGIRSRRAEEP